MFELSGENKDKEGEASFSLYRKKYRSKEFGAEDVQFDPMATRTLFVGNLDKMLTHSELRKIFEKFGDVVVSVLASLMIRLINCSNSLLS